MQRFRASHPHYSSKNRDILCAHHPLAPIVRLLLPDGAAVCLFEVEFWLPLSKIEASSFVL
jgi:hypothetical protein